MAASSVSLKADLLWCLMTTMNDDDKEERTPLERSLREISQDINADRFMIMEYLGPVTDGCRAALGVSVDKARTLNRMSDEEFELYMESTTDSFQDFSVCFRTLDTGEEYSIVFDGGRARIFDECIEPDVVLVSNHETLVGVLDSDPKLAPPDLLGESIHITGSDSSDIVQALGFLCYPSLLRIARSGVDPSSLLSEDADAVIMAAASDMMSKLIKKWIDIHSSSRDHGKGTLAP